MSITESIRSVEAIPAAPFEEEHFKNYSAERCGRNLWSGLELKLEISSSLLICCDAGFCNAAFRSVVLSDLDREMRDSQILSAHEIELLDKWCSQASDSAGYVVEELDELRGKPWDNPHYIKVLRREGEALELNVSWLGGQHTNGRVSGIQSVSESKHHWGPSLKLTGPLVWGGTQQTPPNDFAKLVGMLFKSFAKPTFRPITRELPHLILVSMAVEIS